MSDFAQLEARQEQRIEDDHAGITKETPGHALVVATADIETLLSVIEKSGHSKTNEYIFERLQRDLLAVIEPEAVAMWWDTRTPKLDGRSPRKAWHDGDIVAVARVGWGYLDTSYS